MSEPHPLAFSKMLSESVALVTGAAQGIGLCTARLLLQAGAKVSAVDISSKLKNTCEELGREFKSENILCLTCDVTDDQNLRSVFEQTQNKFGSLDIVINNAGFGDESNWEKTLHVNLYAVIRGTYLALELMSPERGGVVINLGSMAGLYPVAYGPVYSASKHGVVAFSRSMKYYGAMNNIRINCVCPYFAETTMGRTGLDSMPEVFRNEILKTGLITPEKVAEGIMKLVTDTTKNGVVMRVTPRQGFSYHVFQDERKKSKL